MTKKEVIEDHSVAERISKFVKRQIIISDTYDGNAEVVVFEGIALNF